MEAGSFVSLGAGKSPVAAAVSGRFVGVNLDSPSELEAHTRRTLLFCVPEGVTNDQIVDVVIDFLERNPGQRHQGSVNLVFTVFMEAFPCQP